MIDQAALYIYLGIFLALVAAGMGAPIPEELPIVTAGAMVGHVAEPPVPPQLLMAFSSSPGAAFPANLPWALFLSDQVDVPGSSPLPSSLRWWIMLPICICGVVLSDGLLYCVGRFGGRRLLQYRWITRLLPPQKQERIEYNFHKYGILVLLFARFLPAIRSPIFITAGIMRLSVARFFLADGIYAIPGVSLLFYLAYSFGEQFRQLIIQAEGRVEKLKPVLILLALTAVTTYLIYHFFRHPVATGDPREEMPLVGDQLANKIQSPAEPSPVRDQERCACSDGAESKGASVDGVQIEDRGSTLEKAE
jgi:membrane protein DedA with SNARE-associated domain